MKASRPGIKSNSIFRQSWFPWAFFCLSLVITALIHFGYDADSVQLAPVTGDVFADGGDPITLWLSQNEGLLTRLSGFLFYGGALATIGVALCCFFGKEPSFLLITAWSLIMCAGSTLRQMLVSWPGRFENALGAQIQPDTYYWKIAIVALVFLSPIPLAWFYKRALLLQRYLAQKALLPFLFCLSGFTAIWLLVDLSDNLSDFSENKTSALVILRFYLEMLPQIFVSVGPVALLLALLYCLGKMSRSNELISIMGAGISLGRMLMPIFVLGFYISLVCLSLNYWWAPRAEARKDAVLTAIREGDLEESENGIQARSLFYRYAASGRSWYVGQVPAGFPKSPIKNLIITERSPDGSILFMPVEEATWTTKGVWHFKHGQILRFSDSGLFPGTPIPPEGLSIQDWSEKPWNLLNATLNPEYLSVPELTTYLRANAGSPPEVLAPFETHWIYRFAKPFACLVIAMLAAPLGIVYSRRGMLGGVVAAITIFFVYLFLESLFLSMAKGARISPAAGAWIPLILAALAGWFMLHMRSRNRRLFKWKGRRLRPS